MTADATTMNALVGGESGGYRLAEDVEIPTPTKPGTMLCRVHAVALTPYDAKVADFNAVPDAVGGCDFAGTIVKLGEGVTRFKEGDRVFAVTFGLDETDKTAGAFADYALATEDLACHIPEDLSWAQASTLGLGIATAGLALFQSPGLQLALPSVDQAEHYQEPKEFVLVSGGATGTGTMAIQLLKSAGYMPIATCSPANIDLCKSYGAVACFDYSKPNCGAEIREYTADNLHSVFDCVSDVATMKMCYAAIGSSGGQYVALEAISPIIEYTRRDIRAVFLMAPTILGSPVQLPGTYGRPATPEHRDFGAKMFVLAEKLLQKGVIRNHPIEIQNGGLASIPEYLMDLRVGAIKAKRRVVSLQA